MRKIIVFNLVTVDGFFAGPNGEIDWHNYDTETGAYSMEQMRSLGALIFGRTTYDLMASYWPTPEGVKSEPVVAGIMNSILKILREIKPADILELKKQEGGDIAIFGSGTIVQQFANLGLIDEYRLVSNPLVLGSGKPLFKDVKKINLKLIKTKVFKNDNVLHCYMPVKN